MEKEMCQANLSLAFSQDKWLEKNISLKTYMYIKYMASVTLYPLQSTLLFIGCYVEEKRETQENSLLDSLQIPMWILPQSADSIAPYTIWQLFFE